MNILDYAIANKLFGGSGNGEVSGTLDIAANGTYNVAKYAHANVNVASSGGGESGVPIEVTELPTPTAEDVGKVYLNTRDGNYYVVEQSANFIVGAPLGDKIYFDTSVNIADYMSAGENILLLAAGSDEALFQVVAGEPLGGGEQGTCYMVVCGDMDAGVPSVVYVQCDVLTVDQFNEMMGPQMGFTIPKFGWQTDVVDTSAFADCVVGMNALSLWNNFAYSNPQTVIKRVHGDEINNLYGMVDGSITNITSNATHLRRYAFYEAELLQVATLPNVETISESAFSMSGLTRIEAPNATLISRYALGRNNLVVADFPNVTRVADRAFEYCGRLQRVYLPKVTEIGSFAFDECTALQSVTLGATPPTLGGNAFYYCYQLTAIYVPAESVEAYKSATNWSAYADIIQPIVE